MKATITRIPVLKAVGLKFFLKPPSWKKKSSSGIGMNNENQP